MIKNFMYFSMEVNNLNNNKEPHYFLHLPENVRFIIVSFLTDMKKFYKYKKESKTSILEKTKKKFIREHFSLIFNSNIEKTIKPQIENIIKSFTIDFIKEILVIKKQSFFNERGLVK